MLFNSIEFLFAFLPITLIGFFALTRVGHRMLPIWWLILASLFFYGWWNPDYLILISGSILANFLLSKPITARSQSRRTRYAWLTIGVLLNLGLLAYFKYFNFFIANINSVVGRDWNTLTIILPLAISFFTFQQIAFLVDSYQNKVEEHSFSQYCLFVLFFPQLIAGPIVHHSEMMPQFKRSHFRLLPANLYIGGSLIIFGLFKKVCLADNLAIYSNLVFSTAESGTAIGQADAWLGTLAFSLQLYFDFSGYSDIALGLARLFGIVLPANFYSPYQAKNIIDFWRRWHMTLSRFLRDYLYIPLGGNRKGSGRRYVNLMITMLLGGLWHGAGWTFVIWGGLHGTYLMINHGWRALLRSLKLSNRTVSWPEAILYRVMTLLAVSVAWIYFRADSLAAANLVSSSLLYLDGVSSTIEISAEVYGDGTMISTLFQLSELFSLSVTQMQLSWGFIVSCAAVCLFLPNTLYLLKSYAPALKATMVEDGHQLDMKLRPSTAWSIALAMMALCTLLSLTSVSEFIYFQF